MKHKPDRTVITQIPRAGDEGSSPKKGDRMRFCTVINCMDGRVQLPVIRYLQKRFNVDYVDSITEAAPNLILSEQKDMASIQSILERLKISIENHGSVGIAVVGHHGCAKNSAPRDDQIMHIQQSMHLLHQKNETIEIIGLWVDKNREVHDIEDTCFHPDSKTAAGGMRNILD